MRLTERVKAILDGYESDNPGTKANLARILSHGKLGGTPAVSSGAARSSARGPRRWRCSPTSSRA